MNFFKKRDNIRSTENVFSSLTVVHFSPAWPLSVPRIQDMRIAESDDGCSSSSEEHYHYVHRNQETKNSSQRPSLQHQSSRDSPRDSEDGLVGPVPQTASLHRQMTYNELRQMQIKKLKKAGAMGTLDKKSR